jgi:hypothetical protein
VIQKTEASKVSHIMPSPFSFGSKGKSKEYKLVRKLTDKNEDGDVNYVAFTGMMDNLLEYDLREYVVFKKVIKLYCRAVGF